MLRPRLSSYIRTLRDADPSSDAALLRRFADHRDVEAFELLIWRHGALVLGVCRRMLRNHHAAEDAFQATFLILARRAGSIRGSCAAWLHAVARRVCLRSRKPFPDALTVDPFGPAEPDAQLNRELQTVLDAEIARLPEKLRRVVILCYLEEWTTADAALELGIPRGTVLSRLDRARRKLTESITRRGFAPMAILGIPAMSAMPSTALVRVAQQGALAFGTGAAHTPIIELANEVLHMTTRKWIAGTALSLLAVGFAGTGVGLFTVNGAAPSQIVAQAPMEPPKPTAPKPVDPSEADTKRKQQQHDRLIATEEGLKVRIETIGRVSAKEKEARGAGISPSALQQAIEKIDLQTLETEERLGQYRRHLDGHQKTLRPQKDYPIVLNGREYSEVEPRAEWLAYLAETRGLDKEMTDLERKGEKNSANYVAAEAKSKAAWREFEKKIPDIQRRILIQLQERRHAEISKAIEEAQRSVAIAERHPATVAKRRAELVARLDAATSVSDEQKLRDDELQVLREFRKAVLKQRLTLKLEIDGVTLPVEPKK